MQEENIIITILRFFLVIIFRTSPNFDLTILLDEDGLDYPNSNNRHHFHDFNSFTRPCHYDTKRMPDSLVDQRDVSAAHTRGSRTSHDGHVSDPVLQPTCKALHVTISRCSRHSSRPLEVGDVQLCCRFLTIGLHRRCERQKDGINNLDNDLSRLSGLTREGHRIAALVCLPWQKRETNCSLLWLQVGQGFQGTAT